MAWIELTELGSNAKIVVNTDHIISYNVWKSDGEPDGSNIQFDTARQGITGVSTHYRQFSESPDVIEELLSLGGTAVRRPTP